MKRADVLSKVIAQKNVGGIELSIGVASVDPPTSTGPRKETTPASTPKPLPKLTAVPSKRRCSEWVSGTESSYR